MGCVNKAFSLWANNYNDQNIESYQKEKSGLSGIVHKQLAVHNDLGKAIANPANPIEQTRYNAWVDQETGHVYKDFCLFSMLARAPIYFTLSLIRPFVVIGAEIAGVFCEGKLDLIERVKNIARSFFYALGMALASAGMILLPYRCAYILAQIEFNANKGIHDVKSLNVSQGFTIYLTMTPVGNLAQIRPKQILKYKPHELMLADQTFEIQIDGQGFSTKGRTLTQEDKDVFQLLEEFTVQKRAYCGQNQAPSPLPEPMRITERGFRIDATSYYAFMDLSADQQDKLKRYGYNSCKNAKDVFEKLSFKIQNSLTQIT